MHQAQAGQRGSARARNRQLHCADVLADQFQPIEQRRRGNDGRAVLVVVEHRDAHAFGQLFFDVKAFRRLDVFEIDAPQRGFQRRDDVNQLVGIALGQLDVEHIDAGKFLEQATFAFHDRFARQRPDIAQTQNGRAIGHHPHQIATRGVFGRLGWIRLNFQARIGHAG